MGQDTGIVVAVTLRHSPGGFVVKNGSAALWDSRRSDFFSVPEERVALKKAAPGWETSLERQLTAAELHCHDVDTVVVAGCGGVREEYVRSPEVSGLRAMFPHAEFHFEGHHAAHCGAVMPWLTEPAVVMVADAGGDVIESGAAPYFERPREQVSLFAVDGGLATNIGRRYDQPGRLGIGEVFRAFTHWLGFTSQVWSEKVMALAGLDDQASSERDHARLAADTTIQEFIAIGCLGSPHDIGQVVTPFLRVLDLPDYRAGDAPFDVRVRVAGAAQWYLETAVLSCLDAKVSPSLRSIGLTGGCFANCRVVQKVAAQYGLPVVATFAPGDGGLAMGSLSLSSSASRAVLRRDSPFLGCPRWHRGDEVRLNGTRFTRIGVDAVADSLVKHGVVALIGRRGEAGPRALGSSSLVCSLVDEASAQRVFALKQREWFQPLAPMIREADAQSILALDDNVGYEWMEATCQALSDGVKRLRNGVHRDGSSRIQLVRKRGPRAISELLTEVGHRTGICGVVNTSLNCSGAPLADSLNDVVATATALQVPAYCWDEDGGWFANER